jgi:hypothetical protein
VAKATAGITQGGMTWVFKLHKSTRAASK